MILTSSKLPYLCSVSISSSIIHVRARVCVFVCELKKIKLVLDIPSYYMEMLQAWQETSNLRYLEGYINPIIFNNRNICINGKKYI